MLLLLLKRNIITWLSVTGVCSDRMCRSQAADDVLDQAHRHGSYGWLSVKRQDLAARLSWYVVAGWRWKLFGRQRAGRGSTADDDFSCVPHQWWCRPDGCRLHVFSTHRWRTLLASWYTLNERRQDSLAENSPRYSTLISDDRIFYLKLEISRCLSRCPVVCHAA